MVGTRDTLTGLETHSAFLERVEVAFDEAQETGTPVSVALADIDFFGKLNEEHGHAVGDEVISAVARHIRDSVGDAGTVYRCGGEEFGVILPGLDIERAFLLMERIRNDFATVGTPVEAAFSVGVATRPDDGTRGQDLIRKADEGLYRAKLTGRNRVCLARDGNMVTTRTNDGNRPQHVSDCPCGAATVANGTPCTEEHMHLTVTKYISIRTSRYIR